MMLNPPRMEKLPISGRKWALMIGANVFGGILCALIALLPPINFVSVFDGVCGGFLLSNALNMWGAYRRELAFNAMVEGFNSMSTLTNDVLTQWHARRVAELFGDSDTPPEQRTLN